MRKYLIFFTALVLLLSLFGCNSSKDGQKRILVTIYPYELLVKQLVGEDILVQTLIPANISPHGFKPSAKELQMLQNADLVISNGYSLEAGFQQDLDALHEKHLQIESLLGVFTARDSLDANPHVWLSPKLLQQIVIQLSDRLQTSFPEQKTAIGKNTVGLISQLAELDMRIRQERSTFTKTPVITHHDSFQHFFRDYKIDYLASLQTVPGQEPSEAVLASIGEQITSKGIKAIYIEPQLDKTSATKLANKYKLRLIALDPIGKSYKPNTIMDVILNNWEGLKLGW